MEGDASNGRIRLQAKALGGSIDAASGRLPDFTTMVNQGFLTELAGVFDANEDAGRVAASLQQDR